MDSLGDKVVYRKGMIKRVEELAESYRVLFVVGSRTRAVLRSYYQSHCWPTVHER